MLPLGYKFPLFYGGWYSREYLIFLLNVSRHISLFIGTQFKVGYIAENTLFQSVKFQFQRAWHYCERTRPCAHKEVLNVTDNVILNSVPCVEYKCSVWSVVHGLHTGSLIINSSERRSNYRSVPTLWFLITSTTCILKVYSATVSPFLRTSSNGGSIQVQMMSVLPFDYPASFRPIESSLPNSEKCLHCALLLWILSKDVILSR